MIIGSGLVNVPRRIAQLHGAVPTRERIEAARARFETSGMSGVRALIDAVRMLENEQAVVGYFGFTVDIDGLTRKPLEEGESEGQRAMRIMVLPHPQWGHRTGKSTVLGDLVALSEHSMLEGIEPGNRALFSEIMGEAAAFLSRGSSEGEA